MYSHRNSSVSLSGGECVAGVSEINEVCNGLSKSGIRYLWRGTPPVYGETHLVHMHTRTHTHTSQSARPKNCRWGSNAPPVPEQQVDRHFLWCLPSPCVRFKASNMRLQNFLLETKTDRQRTVYLLLSEMFTTQMEVSLIQAFSMCQWLSRPFCWYLLFPDI